MANRGAILAFQALVLGAGGVLAVATPARDVPQFVAKLAGMLALAALPLVLRERPEPPMARLTRRTRRAIRDLAAYRPSRGPFG